MNKNKVIELYKQGYSALKIAKIYNIHHYFIYKILTSNGIKRRSNKENYKIQCDHQYYKDIDSANKAYFLGLLTADGSVMSYKQQSKKIQLSLQKRDDHIIFAFANELKINANKYIKTYTNKDGCQYSRIIIYSDELCDDLIKYNVVPNKTFITKYPIIPQIYNRDYIRGYFDGDGSINKSIPHLKICGTIQVLSEIQKILIQECNLNITKLQQRHKDRDNNIRSLEYGGRKQVRRIYNFLYENANLYLKRKKERFDAFYR